MAVKLVCKLQYSRLQISQPRFFSPLRIQNPFSYRDKNLIQVPALVGHGICYGTSPSLKGLTSREAGEKQRGIVGAAETL